MEIVELYEVGNGFGVELRKVVEIGQERGLMEGQAGQEGMVEGGGYHRRKMTMVSRRKHGRLGPNDSALVSVSERN